MCAALLGLKLGQVEGVALQRKASVLHLKVQ
jgi:hypothetical protein